mmetsp:Transcript_23125/g.34152  ORF Transcript_23125/g.34152 Transcript_23125/m.34152 type:complete len:83 (-) Transcript_23125:148-396(-)
MQSRNADGRLAGRYELNAVPACIFSEGADQLSFVSQRLDNEIDFCVSITEDAYSKYFLTMGINHFANSHQSLKQLVEVFEEE